MDPEKFIPGLELSRGFFEEIVEPLLEQEFPQLEFAAGLIGSGSEVLGYDDPMSTDHHWGPRVMLFLKDENLPEYRDPITVILSQKLPFSYRGYPTNFTSPDLEDSGTQLLEEVSGGPVNHRVEVCGLTAFSSQYLGIDHSSPLSAVDWLIIPGQKLRSFTGGALFRDDSGWLTSLRKKLSYYPDAVWQYMLAAGWVRVGQEEHFLGRTGYRGDVLGSRLIGARLIHDLMNLCFLIERVYPPYSKWFGTAFQELECADTLLPIFLQTLNALDWQSREKGLVRAYEYVAGRFNDLGVTEPLPVQAVQFHGRPFRVIDADRFVKALLAQIDDPEISRIASRTLIGGIEQFSTSTDLLSNTEICRNIREIFF